MLEDAQLSKILELCLEISLDLDAIVLKRTLVGPRSMKILEQILNKKPP